MFEITEFDIAHSKWLKNQEQIRGKSYSIRDSREFEISEFDIAGFKSLPNHYERLTSGSWGFVRANSARFWIVRPLVLDPIPTTAKPLEFKSHLLFPYQSPPLHRRTCEVPTPVQEVCGWPGTRFLSESSWELSVDTERGYGRQMTMRLLLSTMWCAPITGRYSSSASRSLRTIRSKFRRSRLKEPDREASSW